MFDDNSNKNIKNINKMQNKCGLKIEKSKINISHV